MYRYRYSQRGIPADTREEQKKYVQTAWKGGLQA